MALVALGCFAAARGDEQFQPASTVGDFAHSFATSADVASSYETFTQGGSIADRVGKLESTFSEMADEMSGLDSAVGGKVSPGHSGATMKVSGRIHLDYWAFPESDPGINDLEFGNPAIPPQARLGFRRLRFGVAGNVGDTMEYKIEMEFAGGNNSEFRDAYFGFNELPVLQTVLMGNQKRPYGLDHLNSSRYNVFIERPLVIEGFNQDARRLGVCSYGVSENEAFNWRYGVYNQENVQAIGNYLNNSLQLEFAGRLANTLWYDETSGGRGYAHWAVSGSYASPDGDGVPDPAISANEARFRTRPEARTEQRWLNTGRIDGTDDYLLLGLESVLNLGPFQWVAEYQNVSLSRTATSSLHLHGGYFYVSYFLTGEHIPWERDSGTLGRVIPFENFFLVNRCNGGVGGGLGAWQIAARWSYADYNDEDIFGGYGEAFTFGLNWHWNPYSRMQFNYIYGQVNDRDADNDPAAPRLVGGDYQIFGTRFMIDF
jgi:phosphate-selective porin OprO/OprP